MRYKSLALAAAALMAGMLSFSGAQAANVMTGSSPAAGIAKIQDANIQQVAKRYWRRHGGNYYKYNKWGKYNNWGYYNHRRHYGYGYGSGLFLGLGLLPFYSPYYQPYYYQQPYYYPSYAGGGSRHVRYCLNRYRTYSPRSNTFIGYDGYRHRCRSPYRY